MKNYELKIHDLIIVYNKVKEKTQPIICEFVGHHNGGWKLFKPLWDIMNKNIIEAGTESGYWGFPHNSYVILEKRNEVPATLDYVKELKISIKQIKNMNWEVDK